MKTTWIGRTLSAVLAAAMLTGSWAGAYSQKGFEPNEAVLYSEMETAAGESGSKAAVSKVNDYYAAVNAKVLEDHKIGENGGSWNWFYDLEDKSYTEQKALIQRCAEAVLNGSAGTGSSEYKLGALYLLASDMEGRDEDGTRYFDRLMKPALEAETVQEFMNCMAELQYHYGFSAPLDTEVYAPDDTPDRYIVRLKDFNAGVDAADFEDEDAEEEAKTYFTEYLSKLASLSGNTAEKCTEKEPDEWESEEFSFDDSGEDDREYEDTWLEQTGFDEFGPAHTVSERSKTEQSGSEMGSPPQDVSSEDILRIFDFVKDISKSRGADRYGYISLDEMQALLGNLNLREYLGHIFNTMPEQLYIRETSSFRKLNEYLTEERLPLLKKYAYVINLDKFAAYLTSEMQEAKREMQDSYGGGSDGSDNEKTAVKQVSAALAWDMGKLYTEKNFSAEKRLAVEQMVEELFQEYETMLRDEKWLSEATRTKAVNKLRKIKIRIGMPKEIAKYVSNYEAVMREEGGSYLENTLQIRKELTEKKYDAYGHQVDREVWNLLPQEMNPCYYPTDNSINIPVAALEAPYFSEKASKEVNLGAIGTIIAHEITHAFDDLGSKYDENGDYVDWWTKEDRKEFEKRADRIVAYYNNYKTPGAPPTDGKQTLGENLADLGAMNCLSRIIVKKKLSAEPFFESYANIWASTADDFTSAIVSGMDEHAADKVRVNAVLSSCGLFHRTYSVKPGNGMYVKPADRVGFWTEELEQTNQPVVKPDKKPHKKPSSDKPGKKPSKDEKPEKKPSKTDKPEKKPSKAEKPEKKPIVLEEKPVMKPEQVPGNSFAAQPGGYVYADVPSSEWYYSSIMEARQRGLMSGVNQTQFQPDGKFSRAMLVAVLHRLSGSPAVNGTISFEDIESNSWYDKAVAWAVESGVTYGVSSTRFEPETAISRQDFAVMLMRLKKASAVETNVLDGFQDAERIEPYARDAMGWAVENKIIQGGSNGKLAPLDTVTRAQAAAMLIRYDRMERMVLQTCF